MTAHAHEYGKWKSPISTDTVVEKAITIKQIEIDDGEIYWLESRPSEKGRATFIRYSDKKELLPDPFNMRTTVHEYGGNSGIMHNGTLYFSNFKDQALYKAETGKVPELLINLPKKRFADYVIHPSNHSIYAVMEDHTDEKRVINSIVKINLETRKVESIAAGHDFYGAPRLSPDGKKLAYITWDFPNMPWDGTELWLTELSDSGLVESEHKIAGSKTESVLEPSWSPDGKLYFVTDRTGYWNICDEDNEPLIEMSADFASPPWLLGNHSYTFITLNGVPSIAAIFTKKFSDSIAIISLKDKKLKKVSIPYTVLSDIHTKDDSLVFLAGSPTLPLQIVQFHPATDELHLLVTSQEIAIDKSYISIPQLIEFPTTHNKKAYCFYYPPTNPDYTSKDSKESPPLIVFTHGGPTTHSPALLRMAVQYWTSRGFAIADVNYGGSTGFGREYRNRLRSAWGEVCVDDCCNAAKYLSEKGLADKNRLAIRGGSAGGYTTLAALTFRDVFKVGASYYGVSDLELLAKDTHKFESRYLDMIVGEYPKEIERYRALSPLYHTDKLTCPIILFQGAEDKIVPPEQASLMHQALIKKGLTTAYVLFPEEQHGFRASENIKKALEAELYFYCYVFQIDRVEFATAPILLDLPSSTIAQATQPIMDDQVTRPILDDLDSPPLPPGDKE